MDYDDLVNSLQLHYENFEEYKKELSLLYINFYNCFNEVLNTNIIRFHFLKNDFISDFDNHEKYILQKPDFIFEEYEWVNSLFLLIIKSNKTTLSTKLSMIVKIKKGNNKWEFKIGKKERKFDISINYKKEEIIKICDSIISN